MNQHFIIIHFLSTALNQLKQDFYNNKFTKYQFATQN